MSEPHYSPEDEPMQEPAGSSPPPTGQKSDTRTWAMACHLLALSAYVGVPLGNIIGPLVVWLIKREDDPFIDHNGKESLNFQISMTIYGLVAGLLVFVLIGFLLVPAVLIVDLVFTIIAAVKTSNGETYRYPLTIRFVQ